MRALKAISPEKAVELMRTGAVLVDVRERHEHTREHIAGARHHALSQLDAHAPASARGTPLIFHCRSGARTRSHATRLAAFAGRDAYVLDGGIDAWKRAGLPVVPAQDRQPVAVTRQVRIAAGGAALIGILLAWLIAPAFVLITALVAVDFVLGCHGMARLLAFMPWNRRGASAAAR